MFKIKLFSRLLIILTISLIIKSEDYSTNGVCVTNQDKQCSSYCYQVVKVLLDNAASVRSKESRFAEIEKQNIELQASVDNKDLQLADKTDIIDKLLKTYKCDDKIILNADIELLKSTIDDKNTIIQEKDIQINNLKFQLKNFESQINQLASNKIDFEQIITNENNKIIQLESNLLQFQIALKDNNQIIKNNDIQLSSNRAHIQKLNQQIFECRKESTFVGCLDKPTGVYKAQVPIVEEFPVPCDSNLAGSGWTVIQRRVDGSVSFNRNWMDYKNGFGDFNGNYFIGLNYLHLLTQSRPHELYIHLADFNNEVRYAQYSHFEVGNEDELFKLKNVGDFIGTADNSLISHVDANFSTPDRDFIKNSKESCATKFQSGWWFKNCYTCNLNGVYVDENSVQPASGIQWQSEPLKFVQMMIRPIA